MCAYYAPSLTVNFMVIKAPFSQGYPQSQNLVLLFVFNRVEIAPHGAVFYSKLATGESIIRTKGCVHWSKSALLWTGWNIA